MKITIAHIRDVPEAAGELLKISEGKKVFAFYGALGSGKTTIIKAICRKLGAGDEGSSPSFTIVNEYRNTSGEAIYHIDFYRIGKQEEVFDFGLEEYLWSGAYCFMEWPEIVEDMLPPDTFRIRITVEKNGERILETA